MLTPAILAEGWALDSSGAEAVEAYAIGYEVWARLVELEPGHMHDRGFIRPPCGARWRQLRPVPG